MKKLILTSTAILLIAFTSSASDKCSTKEKKNCATKKECKTDNKAACTFSPDKKCSTADAKCKTAEVKKTSTKIEDLKN